MSVQLSPERKLGLFKTLASKTFYEAGVDFGFDKHYKTPSGVKSAVYKLYREILNDPETHGAHPDTVELVENAVQSRAVAPHQQKTVAEQTEEPTDIKEILVSNRDMTASLINRKLKGLSKSKKALNSVSFKELGTLFGILFDKSQIIQGEATEHVAMMGRIDSDMKPEDAIRTVIEMREQSVAEKHAN